MNKINEPKQLPLTGNVESESLRDRLKYYISLKKMTQREFMSKTGITIGMLNDNARLSSIKKIIKEFPELNLYWLVFGNGYEMIRDASTQEELLEQIEQLKIDKKVSEGVIKFLKELLGNQLKEKGIEDI